MRLTRRALGVGLLGGLAACARPTGDDSPAKVSTKAGGYVAGTEVTAAGWRLPSVELTDHHGTKAPMDSHAGKVTLVFFGYSLCPDVCTGILADLASARQRLSEDQRGQVKVILVTTDPARDTPAVLKTYLSRIDPDFVGLTGPLSRISEAATSLGISIEDAKKLPSGGYEIVHSTQVLGFGSDKRAQVLWTEGTSVANYRDDIATLLSKQK